MERTDRRSAFKKLGMGLAAILGVGTVKAMGKESKPKKEVVGEIVQDKKNPTVFRGGKAW